MNIRAILAAGVALLALPGCASAWPKHPAPEPIVQGPPPSNNDTPTDKGMSCMADFLKDRPPINLSVGHFYNKTGKTSIDAQADGDELTNGMPDMAYTGFRKLGPTVHVIERTDTSVIDNEVGLAAKYMLSDPTEPPDPSKNLPAGVYQLKVAQLQHVDWYLTGAVTEVNYTVASKGFEFYLDGLGGGWRKFSMSVALDGRLVNVRTGEVGPSKSESIQIVGYESKVGGFVLLGVGIGHTLDGQGGSKVQQPRQLAVRTVLEMLEIELTGRLYGEDGAKASDFCAYQVRASYNPVGR